MTAMATDADTICSCFAKETADGQVPNPNRLALFVRRTGEVLNANCRRDTPEIYAALLIISARVRIVLANIEAKPDVSSKHLNEARKDLDSAAGVYALMGEAGVWDLLIVMGWGVKLSLAKGVPTEDEAKLTAAPLAFCEQRLPDRLDEYQLALERILVHSKV